MTIDWKVVKQYFTIVLFVVEFYPVCNFGKLSLLDFVLPGMKRLNTYLNVYLPRTNNAYLLIQILHEVLGFLNVVNQESWFK